jgi:hypothetical protein
MGQNVWETVAAIMQAALLPRNWRLEILVMVEPHVLNDRKILTCLKFYILMHLFMMIGFEDGGSAFQQRSSKHPRH